MNAKRFEHLCDIIANKEENPSLTQVGKRELLKCARIFAGMAKSESDRADKLRNASMCFCVVAAIEGILIVLFALGVI